MSSSARYERIMKRRFITSDDIQLAASRGESMLALPENCTVTEEAREIALKLSVRLDASGKVSPAVATEPPARASRPTIAGGQKDTLPSMAVGPKPAVLIDGTSVRVSEAIAAVMKEMNLDLSVVTILPVVTRRVYMGLSSEGK